MIHIFKADAYSKIMLTVIAGCLLWHCFARAGVLPNARAHDARTSSAHERVVEAQEFRLVDKRGHLRALLTVHPGKKAEPYYEDKPGLYLYNQEGLPAGTFGLNDDRAGLWLRDGKGSAELGVTKCQPNGDQGGFLVVQDARGRGTIVGVMMDWHKGPGPAASLKLFNKTPKETIWEAP